jgi:PII-like signaling protein
MVSESQRAVRLRIYLGEEKREGDQPLYQAIIRQARKMHLAGGTVLRGTQGYGRSTRLHTADVLFSDDLPVIVEIIDLAENLDGLIAMLQTRDGIGLMTRESIELCGPRILDHRSVEVVALVPGAPGG